MATKSSLRHILLNPYVQINTILAGAIVAILIYSGIFSATGNYPVHSYYELMTGEISPSSGLSRAFSEIVRFHFQQALVFNPYSIRIFGFFFIQLILRIAFSLLVTAKSSYANKIVVADIILSLIYMIYAFLPFITFLATQASKKF